jgi:hypothetical protein
MNHSIVGEAQRLLKLVRDPLARVPGARRLKRALASPEERLLLEAYDIGMTQQRSEIRSLATLVRELRPSASSKSACREAAPSISGRGWRETRPH